MRLADLGSLGMCLLLLASAMPARAQTQEEKRRQLQERLGIERPPTPPSVTPRGDADAGTIESAPAPGAPSGATPPPVASPVGPRTGGAARTRGPTFADDARPILVARCASCHRPDGMAGKSRWVLRGDGSDHENTLRFVKLEAAAQSPLLKKGTGAILHGGKKSLAAESPEYATLVKWIEAGALPGHAPAMAVAAPTPTAPRLPTVTTPSEAPVPTRVAETPTPVPSAERGTESVAVPASSDDTLRFAPRIHEHLLAGCASCHSTEGFAGSTRYVASPEPEQHLRTVLALVTPGAATTSLLYQRARGDSHQGGAVWEQGSAELALLARWIGEGAQGARESSDVPARALAAPTASSAASPPAASSGPSTASPATATAVPSTTPSPGERHAAPPGVQLGTFPVLGSLTLNGRFDLNYERLGYNDQPFQRGASNALRSYHHFLFLTRQSTSDPVTLTLEMLSLQFWEVGYRISGDDWPVKVSAKMGKVLVPFGAEPLFHHGYGGLAGFDQKVLPPVFAREGLTANVQHREGPFLLSADVYVIAGYQLRRAEAVLNLQSDFAPLEETHLGLGTRLGGSWGPLSLWYSACYNSLGFGRRLFLQSVDVASWRPRGVPVLERFSLGAGFLRADISGGEAEGYGGPGADYYHFASYLQLRFHPTEWLYLQYRQGLRTFGNQRGQILDSTALTREDASAHNVGAVARWKGLSVGLFHFWNLEKVDEVPDDFTRLVVAYEF